MVTGPERKAGSVPGQHTGVLVNRQVARAGRGDIRITHGVQQRVRVCVPQGPLRTRMVGVHVERLGTTVQVEIGAVRGGVYGMHICEGKYQSVRAMTVYAPKTSSAVTVYV